MSKEIDEEALLARVNEIIAPFGCIATEVGPWAVGQQGDNRVYGPSVYVTYPPGTTTEEAGAIATELINKTPGLDITRVLMEIKVS